MQESLFPPPSSVVGSELREIPHTCNHVGLYHVATAKSTVENTYFRGQHRG